MHHGHYNYLPLSPLTFSLLSLALFVLVAMIALGLLRHVYIRLGVSRLGATLLLFGSLIGSYVNIPLFQLSQEQVLSDQQVALFGMVYVVPEVVDWPGTIVAINFGGAVIPILLSIYLLFKHQIFVRGVLAALAVAVVSHLLARPVPGVGIAVPIFIPPIAATIVALVLSRRKAAPLAYIGGCMGTLIGADLANLDKISGLGAPIASIGGAGTFDGVFVTGIIAVLIASLGAPGPEPQLAVRRRG